MYILQCEPHDLRNNKRAINWVLIRYSLGLNTSLCVVTESTAVNASRSAARHSSCNRSPEKESDATFIVHIESQPEVDVLFLAQLVSEARVIPQTDIRRGPGARMSLESLS